MKTLLRYGAVVFLQRAVTHLYSIPIPMECLRDNGCSTCDAARLLNSKIEELEEKETK